MKAARKIMYEMPPPPLAKPQPKTKIKSARRVEYIRFDSRRYRIPIHILFTVVLIFAGGVGTAFSFAYLHDMRRQMNNTRRYIQEQRAENIAVQAEIARHLSIDEVSRIAREYLNMGPPDVSQIVRINVPHQSYVVQSYAPYNPRPQGMWRSAWWYIKNWLGVG